MHGRFAQQREGRGPVRLPAEFEQGNLGIAVGEQHQLDFADLAGFYCTDQRKMTRFEALHEAHEAGHASPPDLFHRGAGAGDVLGQRLFAEDRLARARSRDHQLRVGTGRRRDDDRVDFGVGQGAFAVMHG